MSLIRLDDFKDIDNKGEIKIPRVDTTWNVTFNDEFRKEASFIATKIEKIYQNQSGDDYDKELLKLTESKRKARIAKDLAEYRDACIDGVSSLLNDGKAGKQIYDAYDGSTEVLAQIIERLNEACDKALDLDAQESKERMSKYDAD